MMPQNLLSVIIPVYNDGLYLEKCVNSVIHQTYPYLEIILVDDGSTDCSGEICDNFSAMDKRIKVIHKENGGVVTARKAGLDKATGEYIAFVDGDDWVDAKMYSDMLKLCADNDADFVESGYVLCRKGIDDKVPCKEDIIYLEDKNREKIISEWMQQLPKASVRHHIWSKIYKADIINQTYSKIDDRMALGEDIICYLHLIKNSTRIAVTSKIYYHYMFREDLSSHYSSIRQLRDNCGLFYECCKLIREMYPMINEEKLDVWFVRHTIEDFYKLNLDKEVPRIIYRIANIEELRNKKVVIYGAGNAGKDIYLQLCKYGDIQIVDWVDKNNEKYNYSYYTVHNPDVLCKLEYDIILIAVLREKLAESIKSDILKYGCSGEKIVWKKIVKLADQLIPEPVGYNIVKFEGGLGNQMFQYAFYRSLQEMGQKVTANIDFFEIYNTCNFELPQVFPKSKMSYDEEKKYESYKNSLSFHEFYLEPQHSVCDVEVYKKRDCSFLGYWQTEKYFENIKEEIRKEFLFDPKEAKLIQLAKRIRSEKSSVSVHVRRGDYLEMSEMYGNICTVNYYNKAIKYVKEKLKNPIFYVFSDDLEWTKENISISNANYICDTLFEDYQNWYDMFLMSCCHHNIIANSSFSWWGAWLNPNDDKLIVSPDRWLNGESTKDIWCDSWVRIRTEE